jgi:hypothetical protein
MADPSLATKFVKRPVEVEAVRLTNSNYREVASWCNGTYHFWLEEPTEDDDPVQHLMIRFRTVQQEPVTADEGDWIVKGPHGDFWPVKDFIFSDSYQNL